MRVDASGLLHVGQLAISPWIYGAVLFLVFVGVFWLVQWLVLRRMRRSERPLVSKLGKALVLPVMMTILVVGLLLFQRVVPLPAAVDGPFGTVVKVLLILLGFVVLDRVVVMLLHRLADHTGSAQVSQGIVKSLTHVVVFSLALLVILGTLGISITPLIASLGVASLAVGLALQAPLANFFAGLFILTDKELNVGDFIKLESGEEGYIERVSLRHTTIRMLPNIFVIVPNDKLVQSRIHNTSLPDPAVSLLIQVGVHYDSDLEQVERVTVEVARHIQQTVEGAVPEHEPFIRFHTFDSSSINFTVILRARDFVAGYAVKHEFIKALYARYRKEGIVIPYPQQTFNLAEAAAEKLQRIVRPDK
ncbi:mechanosensitive ion channel family protein [candidate division WOR-3 bacterium]|nr:mechanosensitive ion channel family protein [candidate division WOR-3 bacterium]